MVTKILTSTISSFFCLIFTVLIKIAMATSPLPRRCWASTIPVPGILLGVWQTVQSSRLLRVPVAKISPLPASPPSGTITLTSWWILRASIWPAVILVHFAHVHASSTGVANSTVWPVRVIVVSLLTAIHVCMTVQRVPVIILGMSLADAALLLSWPSPRTVCELQRVRAVSPGSILIHKLILTPSTPTSLTPLPSSPATGLLAVVLMVLASPLCWMLLDSHKVLSALGLRLNDKIARNSRIRLRTPKMLMLHHTIVFWWRVASIEFLTEGRQLLVGPSSSAVIGWVPVWGWGWGQAGREGGSERWQCCCCAELGRRLIDAWAALTLVSSYRCLHELVKGIPAIHGVTRPCHWLCHVMFNLKQWKSKQLSKNVKKKERILLYNMLLLTSCLAVAHTYSQVRAHTHTELCSLCC